MKKIYLKTLFFIIISLIPLATSAANISVIHGINGLDLGFEKSLPVDIALAGECALTNIAFGKSTVIQLPEGSYAITVHPFSGDCSAAPVIDQVVTIPAGVENIGLVAQLSDSGIPRLKAFINDFPANSIIVNNAAKGLALWSGAGIKGWIFYYGKFLRNGDGIMQAGFGDNRRLKVVMFRKNQSRAFYRNTFRAGKTVIVYVLGSRKNGELVISERLN
jgi:hypothetical protein